MRQPLLLISVSLAVLLPPDVLAQDPVQIQFQTDPVLVRTDAEIVFTVQTVPEVLSMTWLYQDITLGLWSGGNPVLNEVAQFQGRVSITATQLRIDRARLPDAGDYTVRVTPLATTGLTTNSRSIKLSVFAAVAGVSLAVPSVASEGGNISLSCTWTAGTDVSVQWGKGGAAITADSRITISEGSLVINPARRGDAGEYTCTVSNPVSAELATSSLTVFYGPDAPLLTKDTPKECVGGGDMLDGQTVRLTCTSDSLPPALFSWQRNGEPVASGQPDSGALSLPTLTTDESGRYVCTARNSITGGTSERDTDLAVVAACLNGGEVAGIVIGCFLLLLIIVLLIVCLVLRWKRRRQRDAVAVQKTNTNPRPIPPDPRPNGAQDVGQGLRPPLFHVNTNTHNPDRLYADRQTLRLNNMHTSDTRRHNGRTYTNRVRHNAPPNTNSTPHNGIDNPAFAHTDAPNANTLANTQQQNPNIVIQTGNAQGGAAPPAVHLSLNTLPQTAQQNSNAPMPTIHVNLNSYSTNGQQTQQENSLPFTNTVNSNATQTPIDAVQSNPTMQSGPSYPSNTLLNPDIGRGHQAQSGPVPTGYTHSNINNTAQRNANTQTYQQGPETNSWSDGVSPRHDAAGSSHRAMPWDRLRGTPAYPSGRFQRGETSGEVLSDTTDYTTHPPLQQARTINRSQPQSHTTSQTRAPPGRDVPSLDRQTRSHSADRRGLFTLRVPQLEPAHHTHSRPHTQRENAQQDIRGPPGSEHAPRQEATHRNNPQALPLMSQQASVDRPAVSQGPATQQRGIASQGADARALADPNHLPQGHMPQQPTAAQTKAAPQGTQTHGAGHPHQRVTAPVLHPSAQPSNLTQDALKAHTDKTQTFQNRRQQTQAALLARAPAAGAQHAPTPPPVIPLTQFQTLPKDRTQHRSPARGPQPPRPPANIPVAQRHQQRNVQHHPTTMHNGHHHHHGNVHDTAHRHAHTGGRGHPAHFTHQQHQQAHRGRPR